MSDWMEIIRKTPRFMRCEDENSTRDIGAKI